LNFFAIFLQAHAMLSGTRIKPPQLDEFFSAAEAPLRAAEFSDLGWTEETVWGRSNAWSKILLQQAAVPRAQPHRTLLFQAEARRALG
jgi:hypothetical protein